MDARLGNMAIINSLEFVMNVTSGVHYFLIAKAKTTLFSLEVLVEMAGDWLLS